MFQNLMLTAVIGKFAPLIIPPLVMAVRTWVLANVPAKYIPVILAVLGAGVSSGATALGIDGVPADLAMLSSAAWDGALVGLASTGVHQLVKQLRAKPAA